MLKGLLMGSRSKNSGRWAILLNDVASKSEWTNVKVAVHRMQVKES